MCKALASLFPAGAVVAELREPGDVSRLLPAETACLGGAVIKRAREFAGGRECARRALAEFGINDFPIVAARDRQPVWPDQFTGSITHTRGLCAAVVVERDRFLGVGIDIEIAGEVRTDLWPAICVPEEIAWLQSLPHRERTTAATLLFSAKEAYYKCQYPVTGRRLNFHDLRIEPHAWGAGAGAFDVRLLRRRDGAPHCAGMPVNGRYLLHESFVSTGVAWPAARGSINRPASID